MEMTKFSIIVGIFFTFVSCSNTPELETGEIKTLKFLKNLVDQPQNQNVFIDARKLLNRKQIDNFDIPILFVELQSGQNGTLTPYPGKGVGQTWLGADGATVTLDNGVLKASRGMGDDLMGATSSMPSWSTLGSQHLTYTREMSYLNGSNKIDTYTFSCQTRKNNKRESLNIWGTTFSVLKYEEECNNNGSILKNTYYLDESGLVRKSRQYHSKTLGHIIIERLDR